MKPRKEDGKSMELNILYEAIKICKNKGIHMQEGKLNPKNYTDEEFDLITSFEVLEHINNPVEEIKNYQ